MTALEGVILGALLAIPISVLAPIATPRVSQRLARRNEQRARIHAKDLQADLELIESYKRDPTLLHGYMIRRILITTLISALTALLSGLCFAGANMVQFGNLDIEDASRLLATMGQLVAVSGSAGIVAVVTTTYRTLARVRDFDSYSEYVRAQIAELHASSTA